MIVALSFCDKDYHLALNMCRWMVEIGNYNNHTILLVYTNVNVSDITSILTHKFNKVIPMEVPDAMGEWPSPQNTAFRRTCKYIEELIKEPFLWIESDTVPLTGDWIDRIESEYKSCGKLFMGYDVNWPSVTVRHMSGNAVYPHLMSSHGSAAMMCDKSAWDIAVADQVFKSFHSTTLIEHAWKPDPFNDISSLERIPKESVLYHQAKNTTLIDRLREKRIMDQYRTVNESLTVEPVKRDSPVFDVLIKSFQKDFLFLEYCIQSLNKFATGFRQIVLVLPEGELRPVLSSVIPIVIKDFKEHGDGYMQQQCVKIQADIFTDADYIMHVDSDTIFKEPITPQSFMTDGKFNWVITPFSSLGETDRKAWYGVISKFSNSEPEFEFMRRFPFLLPSNLYGTLRQFCLDAHQCTISEYIMNQPAHEFSEFNCLGYIAYTFRRDQFNWIDSSKVELEPARVLQYWSWGGLTDDIRKQIEDVLNTTNQVEIKEPELNISFIEGCSHYPKWIKETGRLDHDQWLMERVLPHIRPGDTVIDCGAHIGTHARAYKDKVGEQGTVICFEPSHMACRCLLENCPDCIVLEIGLSDKESMMLPEYSANSGETFLTNEFGDESNVECRTLDSLDLLWADFIKIDVEGMELRVLEGAKELIKRCKPRMLIEINTKAYEKQGNVASDVYDWLNNRSYSFHPVQPNIDLYSSEQFDILCIPLRVTVVKESLITVPVVKRKPGRPRRVLV